MFTEVDIMTLDWIRVNKTVAADPAYVRIWDVAVLPWILSAAFPCHNLPTSEIDLWKLTSVLFLIIAVTVLVRMCVHQRRHPWPYSFLYVVCLHYHIGR